jgi:hypothetical protein
MWICVLCPLFIHQDSHTVPEDFRAQGVWLEGARDGFGV